MEANTDDEEDTCNEVNTTNTLELNEWEMLSQMGITNNVNLDELQILGRRDFDSNNN